MEIPVKRRKMLMSADIEGYCNRQVISIFNVIDGPHGRVRMKYIKVKTLN